MDEVKYINAGLLPSLFDEEYKGTVKMIEQGETHLDNIAEGFLEAYQVILKMPAADVLEVRHGRWEQDYQDKWRCSVCKVGNNYAYAFDDETKDYTKLQDNYCPNCGAKMDEE